MKLILACCNIKNIVIFKTYTEIKIIYDFIRFEIHLPAVVAVDGVPVFNVVVTIVLVVGVIPVIAVIKVHIELNYYLRNKFRINLYERKYELLLPLPSVRSEIGFVETLKSPRPAISTFSYPAPTVVISLSALIATSSIVACI